jgi:hypothetical protein
MITTIATVAVYVEDQQKSVDFWTRQVGFRVHSSQSMGPEGSWIEVGPAESTACLVLYPKQIMPDWAERKPSVVFNADDMERSYAEMTAAASSSPSRRRPWPGASSPSSKTSTAIRSVCASPANRRQVRSRVATDGGSGVSTCGERSWASIAAVDVQDLAGDVAGVV